jgi:hypothetical protein
VKLERHLAVLWRYRLLTALGLLLGIALALMAAFQIGPDGLERRGAEQWSSTSQIFVTQQGFGWGRATLPIAKAPDATGNEAAGSPQTPEELEGIKFADPGRFTNLALLYSVISASDEVRGKLPGPPAPEQIVAGPLDPTGKGDNFLPIITLITTDSSPERAIALNNETVDGLKKWLVDEQDRNDIGRKDRVLLSTLSKPSAPVLVAGRSMTPSILAFMLCLIATVALAHILEGVRLARGRREAALMTFWESPSANGAGTHPIDDLEPVIAEAGAGEKPRRRASQ